MSPKPHFWATLEIASGIQLHDLARPGFFYEGEYESGYLIWRVCQIENLVGFSVVDESFWESIHKSRCTPGCKFVLRDGRRDLAFGVVVGQIQLEESVNGWGDGES